MMPPAGQPLVVVKLGGSLLGSPRLDAIIGAVLATRSVRAVIVPGGGLLADAVRRAQKIAGFGDVLAHRLALDAMDHLGEILAERHDDLVPSVAIADFALVHGIGRIPLWSTAEIRAGHPAIPESWAMTSDSLALWLAAEIGAERLVLVKSVDPPDAEPAALVEAGILDEGFPLFAERYRGEIVIAGPARDADFAALLEAYARRERAA